MTELQLRQQLCDAARSYLGCRVADGSHRPIIDRYNAIRPLPGGVKLGYADPWCAAFVSAAAAQCDLEKIVFPHCNCQAMLALYKAAGRWEEQDFAVPHPGDVIFYDWDDDGVGDCTGTADHVGVVTAVTGDLLTVVEGNKSDAVSERKLYAGARFIRGYGQPDYASLTTEDPIPAPASSTPVVIAKPVTDVPGCGNPSPQHSNLKTQISLPILSRGDKGETVRALQLLLIGRGCRCGPWGADGDFGAATQGAVESYQRGHKLSMDGVVGPATWSALLGV